LRNAEQHGRDQHNLTSIDEDTRNKVRSKITRAA
jgi:predicted small metal-binding protein